jgi:hypothetical protein
MSPSSKAKVQWSRTDLPILSGDCECHFAAGTAVQKGLDFNGLDDEDNWNKDRQGNNEMYSTHTTIYSYTEIWDKDSLCNSQNAPACSSLGMG